MIELKQITQTDLSAEPDFFALAGAFPTMQTLVKVEDGEFVLDNGHYRIEVERVDDYGKLVRWLHHLMGKRWATKEVLEQFVEVVCKHHNLQLHRMED